jgi:outer membrane protein insertion porin family
VSTRGLQTNVLNPVRKDPIGSDTIFLASTEMVVPLFGENISGLFFVDSGTVDTGRYRVSIGTGIQITIPQLLGTRVPMRFEIATPLQKDDEDETQFFSFYMGRLY